MVHIKKVKGISYDTDDDRDVIRYLNTIENYSKYVIGLIRDDMLCQHKWQSVIDHMYNEIQNKQVATSATKAKQV